MFLNDVRNIQNNGYINYPHLINTHCMFEWKFYTFVP